LKRRKVTTEKQKTAWKGNWFRARMRIGLDVGGERGDIEKQGKLKLGGSSGRSWEAVGNKRVIGLVEVGGGKNSEVSCTLKPGLD